MTPQETQLVNELFDRLAKLESAPRDPAAERLIADGLERGPHAVYALVQTALLQDEALKRANARIEELQAQVTAAGEPEQRQGSFLDSMREAFGGRAPARGSVPSVRAAGAGYQSQGPQSPGSQPGYPPPPPGPPYSAGPGFGSSGSFLGTAAASAAGFIGGALLLDGIRSMFGHHLGGTAPNSFGNFADDQVSPWSGSTSGSAADSQLARDAGIDHVDDSVGQQVSDVENDPSAGSADSFDTADDQNIPDDNDFDDDDFGGDDGGAGGDTYDA